MTTKYDEIAQLLTTELPELSSPDTITVETFTKRLQEIYEGKCWPQMLNSNKANVSFNFTPRGSAPSHGIVFYTSNRYGRVEPITQDRLDVINSKLEKIGDPEETV